MKIGQNYYRKNWVREEGGWRHEREGGDADRRLPLGISNERGLGSAATASSVEGEYSFIWCRLNNELNERGKDKKFMMTFFFDDNSYCILWMDGKIDEDEDERGKNRVDYMSEFNWNTWPSRV